MILKHSIQSSTDKAILNQYKTDDLGPDSRAAFLAIDARMTTGLTQIYSVTNALKELDKLNIQTFSDTRTSFLNTWLENSENSTAPVIQMIL